MIGRGYVHIYTGNGKGKTSAALGLAFRAAGSGLATLVIQFMKGLPSGERDAAAMTGELIRVESYGSERFCRPDDGSMEEHRALARNALERSREAVSRKERPIVVLDEILTACLFGIVTEDEILDIIDMKPEGLELVLTGRGASEGLIERGDLVTEMREVKHYYREGVPPRKGIED